MADTMLLLASRDDAESRTFTGRSSDRRILVLTAADLSRAGWRYSPGEVGSSEMIVGEARLRARDICGVLTRTPGVHEDELPHLAAEDRSYVAAEMNAFLLAWLCALDCAVVNRPVPGSLCGPMWSPLQWRHAAAQAGLTVTPATRQVPPARTQADSAPAEKSVASHRVTVLGDWCTEDAAPAEQDAARRLAEYAGVDLLAVSFSSTDGAVRFEKADLRPPLTPPLWEALWKQFTSHTGAPPARAGVL